MALNFAGATTITAAGSSVATIDANGNFNITNRPEVFASQSGTGTEIGSDIIFNNVTRNVGGYYNVTNGRFTAPVAGVYHITWRQLANHVGVAGEYTFAIYVNGVEYVRCYNEKQVSTTWNSNSHRTHLKLNVGDYCTMRYIMGSSSTYTDSNYNRFSICQVQ